MKILLAVDGSPISTRAVRHVSVATKMTADGDTPVTVVR